MSPVSLRHVPPMSDSEEDRKVPNTRRRSANSDGESSSSAIPTSKGLHQRLPHNGEDSPPLTLEQRSTDGNKELNNRTNKGV
jgi:hypothetical protein